ARRLVPHGLDRRDKVGPRQVRARIFVGEPFRWAYPARRLVPHGLDRRDKVGPRQVRARIFVGEPFRW
ncbi:hypothetical protein, partial [Hymenobacter coccineus]|uniref:hypothetical protein n=1 Tax=Hymenobacter coccineus TaxID=1908235 RepID=UPI00130185E6